LAHCRCLARKPIGLGVPVPVLAPASAHVTVFGRAPCVRLRVLPPAARHVKRACSAREVLANSFGMVPFVAVQIHGEAALPIGTLNGGFCAA
jgi:hypothetical protein